MSEKWPRKALSDICNRITSGGTPSRKQGDYFGEEGHLWVKSKELGDGYIEDTEEKISDEALAHSSAKYIPDNSVLMAMYGATVGQLGYLRVPATVNQAVCALIPNPEVIDGRYLFHLLKYERPGLVAQAHGAAQQNLNQGLIRDYEVPVPPLEVQRTIALPLNALDDLIANNNRRIEILEQVARAIYRHWFVDFKYPSHEDVPLMESELGPIPEGWEILPVDEVFDVLGGGTPSTKQQEYWDDGSVNWFTPSDLTAHGQMFIDSSERKITEAGLAGSSAKLFDPGSVMMTSRATLGVTAINTEPACTNQGFITCIPNESVSAYQIYFWIEENLDLILNLASGATFKEISKRVFREIPFLRPPPELGAQYVELVDPLLQLARNLIAANDRLGTTRDLLLPKLVSGEIDVSELDVGEAA